MNKIEKAVRDFLIKRKIKRIAPSLEEERKSPRLSTMWVKYQDETVELTKLAYSILNLPTLEAKQKGYLGFRARKDRLDALAEEILTLKKQVKKMK